MTDLQLGTQICGDLDAASAREWLCADGLGGYAMGTVGGLRTRRYHGLLIVATSPPGGRMLGLAAIDPVLYVGADRYELATHEWEGGALAPRGFEMLQSFELTAGVPSWRWTVGGVILQCEVAAVRGRAGVGVTYRLIGAAAPGQCRLELRPLCTWRDVHGERFAWDEPAVQLRDDGFVFEGAYTVRGPGFTAEGSWYRGDYHREEAARGLNGSEDLWCPGWFSATIEPGQTVTVEAWAGGGGPPARADAIVAAARARFIEVTAALGSPSPAAPCLAHAADQFIVSGSSGPTVVAGYPWFGDWSRDTMTSYEGLFLATRRSAEGRSLLVAAAATISQGMLANTADAGGTEYNTVDGTLWFLHALGRHVEVTDDLALGAELLPAVESMIEHHMAGTRFGIRIDDDGLVAQGADGWALTWMDARVNGVPITARRGKPVEVNALWIRGLAVASRLAASAKSHDRAHAWRALRERALASFTERFMRPDGGGLFDVIDGPDGDDASVRPNQLLAVSLPDAPIDDPAVITSVVEAVRPLVTPLGLRSLSPNDPRYSPLHRGGPAQRDAAYHQGTVWPWLVGPYVDALRRVGVDGTPLLVGMLAHVFEWGLGSISETANGQAPHGATGCPFQAWSVAEVLRVLAGSFGAPCG